uniref:Sulfotransferase domain-containing protein n=1 Tax=Timema shepardi TaxID=629360 RepID=A0A7R9B5C8_TIMSH|nr:unnamed protein product [Timema shepardi]
MALEAMKEFPLEIRDVDPELNKQLLQDFDGERTGWVQVGPEGYLFPSSYKIHGPRIYNLKVRPDDTWIVTFPRSGTTLSQEMIWLIANQMDFETASNVALVRRFTFLEVCLFVNDKLMDEYRARYHSEPEKLAMIDNLCALTYEVIDVTPSPRFIKTHLPFSLLPPDLLESGAKKGN